jgi:hypothetical protein
MRVGAWAAYASGAIGAIGLVFLIGLYAAFAIHWEAARLFGWLNDVLVMIQYFIALPIALALHTLLGPRNPLLSRVAMVIGIGGMLAVVVFQLLLVAGALTFQQQVVPVSIALLVVGGLAGDHRVPRTLHAAPQRANERSGGALCRLPDLGLLVGAPPANAGSSRDAPERPARLTIAADQRPSEDSRRLPP